MIRRVVLGWLSLVLVVNAPAQAQNPFSRDLVPSRTALARLGLERNWMGVVPLTGNEKLIEISISENLLFAHTSFANFHVYDNDSGQYLWTANLGQQTGDALPASVNSFAVFVTNANQLFALDRRTGRPIWVQGLETLPSSSTACDEGRVMVGLTSGKLIAFSLKVKDKNNPAIERVSGRPLPLWNWQTGAPVTAPPRPAGPVVAFGSRDGKVYVALAEVQTMLYRFATGGEITAPLGAYGTRTLLIPSSDKNVYAVDLWSAETLWTFSSGAPVQQIPLVGGEDVYTVNTAGILSALDAKTGEPRWRVSTHNGRLVAISPTRVYLESQDGDLFIVDRGTGNVVADPRTTHQRAGLVLRDYTLALTNGQNDRMYFATPSGMVICLREVGQVSPRPLRDLKAQPFGYVPPEGIKLEPQPVVPAPQPGAEPAAPAEEKEKEKAEPAPEEKGEANPK